MDHLEALELAEWRRSPAFRAQLVEALYQKARAKKTSYLFIPLADAYAAAGEPDNAIAVLRGGLLKHPGSRAGQVLIAQLLYDRGEEEEALHYLEPAVATWPDNPAAVTLLAKIVARRGDLRRAASMTERLIAWYPDSRFIRKNAAHYAALAERQANETMVEAAPLAEPKPQPVVDETKPVVRRRPPPPPRKRKRPVTNTSSEEKPLEEKSTAEKPTAEKPVSPPIPPDVPQLVLTPTMIDNGPHDHDDDEAEIDPMDRSTVFLPEPEPEPKRLPPPRRPSKRKEPEGQLALFRLESMLDTISRLKGEREKD